MLNKNIIRSNKPEMNEGISAILKQKPNRKILGVFRFHLGVYTLANRGRQTKFKRWVKKTIGEEPVILDPVLTVKSRGQVLQYVQNAGYFNAAVSDTTVYLRRKKANVIYSIVTGQPYILNKISYNIPDPSVEQIVLTDSVNSLLKAGHNFNTNDFQNERERVTTLLRNRGYYDFNQLFISYNVDTALQSHLANVILMISGTNVMNEQGDSVQPGLHKVYTINDVFIQTDYDPLAKEIKVPTDTVIYKDYRFISSFPYMRYKPDALLARVFIEKGDIYKISNADYTYKGLASLSLFKFINIRYEPVVNDTANLNMLNSIISLSPSPKQDYKIELEGTHNGGNFGIGGNFTYRNKNTFRGAESFELKLKAKIESIPDFVDTTADQTAALSLNTYELGPELTVRIPRLLWPIAAFNRSRNANPVTLFTASYNYQQRPEYKRNLLVLSSGFEFRETKFKKHYVYPAEINYSNFSLTQPFLDKLNDIGDQQLILYYRSYLITNGRYTFIHNTQDQSILRNFSFFRFSFEIAGNSMRLIDKLTRSSYTDTSTYKILGINYSQYIRPDFDYRYYQVFSTHTSIVYRLAAGIGIAYLNSSFVPYEKTFFAGGANDLRAFRARTVGPGSYKASNFIEQLGDIKINSNIEYRFDIFRILEGALFVDAGNIWLRDENRNLPGSRFKSTTFLNELAIGSGIGFRLDFTFFIFRMDAAVPLKDPSRPEGDRIVIKYLKPRSTVLNFGIGYPF
jgi:outer membrane protein assembly factor BamA